MKIGILGLGITGSAVADFALRTGEKVFISESKSSSDFYRALTAKHGKIPSEFGGHTSRLLESDLIVKSPGIMPGEGILALAARRGIPVVGELDYVLGKISCGKIVAITGTNGKTTTTAFVGDILKNLSGGVIVCGNIGLPLAAVADRVTRNTTLVMEVSSYQLEDSREFRPDVAVILNIAPDHLEHHGTMKAYVAAKSRIFARQGPDDFCIFNGDDKICARLSEKCPSRPVFFSRRRALPEGVYYKNGYFHLNLPSRRAKFAAELLLPGAHNVENALAAFAAACLAGAGVREMTRSAEKFRGVEHRIEFVRKKNGVVYINDSKATNVDSARVALESLDGKIWLILGGRDKGSPYAPLKNLLRKKVAAVFLIGEAAGKIERDLKGSTVFYRSGDLASAVKAAAQCAAPGDTVLLSPACASYDQFDNFEHRGAEFKRLAGSL